MFTSAQYSYFVGVAYNANLSQLNNTMAEAFIAIGMSLDFFTEGMDAMIKSSPMGLDGQRTSCRHAHRDSETWERFLRERERGTTETEIPDNRCKAVFHMVFTTDGAKHHCILWETTKPERRMWKLIDCKT